MIYKENIFFRKMIIVTDLVSLIVYRRRKFSNEWKSLNVKNLWIEVQFISLNDNIILRLHANTEYKLL